MAQIFEKYVHSWIAVTAPFEGKGFVFLSLTPVIDSWVLVNLVILDEYASSSLCLKCFCTINIG